MHIPYTTRRHHQTIGKHGQAIPTPVGDGAQAFHPAQRVFDEDAAPRFLLIASVGVGG